MAGGYSAGADPPDHDGGLSAFCQFFQILEQLAVSFRRFIAFALFFRVTDKRTQLLAIKVREQRNGFFRHGVITGDQAFAQIFEFMQQDNLLVMAVFQFVECRGNRLRVTGPQQFTDEL